MNLYTPISSSTPHSKPMLALPDPTTELCGPLGIYAALGNTVLSNVYRGTFDQRSGRGSWNFCYLKHGDSELVTPEDIN